MIPYDDLVIALATWRANQGLPVVQLSGALTPPPAPRAVPAAPPRAAPPAPPARAAAASPLPLAPPDTHDEEVDGASLIEESHYENEGDDFAMAFGKNVEAESTAIGVPPPVRDSFGGGSTQPDPEPETEDMPPRRPQNDDW